MQTVITAAGAAELLAVVPVLAGYRPRRSLALVLFRRSRSLGVMRIDLPAEGEEVERTAATVLGMVCKVDAADSFVAVVYADGLLRPHGPSLVHAELIDALRSRADLCGVAVGDALCVADDGWSSYLDPDAPARELAEIAVHASDPILPAAPIADDQSLGAALADADPDAAGRTASAVESLERAIAALIGHRATGAAGRHWDPCTAAADGAAAEPPEMLTGIDPRSLAAACALDDLPELFEDALHRTGDPDPHEAAALLWCLARPSTRDVALVQWCEDLAAGDEALEAQLDWEGGAEYPERIAERFWGVGVRPDASRMTAALNLLRRLVAAAPTELRPGPLAAAAWVSWALGRSTHASEYASAALAIDAEHGLSQIVLTMVSAGHLPEWAFERR